MQTISVGYGKVNFDTASLNSAAFVVTEPFVRTFPSKAFARRGGLQNFPVTDHPEINGTLMLETITDVADGATFLFQTSMRQRGLSVRDGGLWFSPRAQGPMYMVKIRLPYRSNSLVGNNFPILQGRGDLLTLEQVEDRGIVLSNSWVEAFMDEDELRDTFDIQEVGPEIAAAPVSQRVTSLSGKQVVITNVNKGRRIKLR